MEKNVFNWIEISVSEFNRARIFYENIFAFEMEQIEFGGHHMGFFPGYDEEVVGGAIVAGPGYEPTDKGAIVYFNANPDLQAVLDRVVGAGGKVLQDKKQISEEYGFMALILDTEGNRIALHSDK